MPKRQELLPKRQKLRRRNNSVGKRNDVGKPQHRFASVAIVSTLFCNICKITTSFRKTQNKRRFQNRKRLFLFLLKRWFISENGPLRKTLFLTNFALWNIAAWLVVAVVRSVNQANSSVLQMFTQFLQTLRAACLSANKNILKHQKPRCRVAVLLKT